MKEFCYTITDPLGFHGRPVSLLAKKAGEYHSTVTIASGTKKADTRRVMSLMTMNVKQGASITVQVEGPDEELVARVLEEYLKSNHY